MTGILMFWVGAAMVQVSWQLRGQIADSPTEHLFWCICWGIPLHTLLIGSNLICFQSTGKNSGHPIFRKLKHIKSIYSVKRFGKINRSCDNTLAWLLKSQSSFLYCLVNISTRPVSMLVETKQFPEDYLQPIRNNVRKYFQISVNETDWSVVRAICWFGFFG